MTNEQLDQLSINTIRTLSMDAVQQANSGHPGAPMALAPVAYTVWQHFLRFDPEDPIWPNRDRFVLSNGHASMLLYSLLHLCGVKAVNPQYETLGELSVKLEDIKRFRQLDSRCPGHPEYRWTSGVETTTGPLGQGVGNSVGMAMARWWMAKHFNRPGFEMFDYDVYVICGDGDMMEGITGEAASLAGHHRLSNLCWIYDNNKITIEGHTALAFSEDVATRFIGYGWNVTRVSDANDLEMLERALQVFKSTTDRPTLIIVDSHIAYGAPHKQDTSGAHGEPLGEEEVRLAKRAYGWPEDAKFLVPEGVREHFRAGMGERGQQLRDAWMARFEEYKAEYPDLADQLDRMLHRQLPEGWDKDLPTFPADAKGLATRDSSGTGAEQAGLEHSVADGRRGGPVPFHQDASDLRGRRAISKLDDRGGRNMHFGIREHAMGAIVNGLSLSKIRAYGSTFLIFSDYMKPPIRLAAIMDMPVIHVFTHDSIGVGEDGPTHQPIEQLASLRAVPGLVTLRPADANEVVECWRFTMKQRHQPVALILTRQALPTLDRTKYAAASGVERAPTFWPMRRTASPTSCCWPPAAKCTLCVQAYEQLSDGRREGAGGEHAELGAVRAAAAGVSRDGAAAGGYGARFGGAGFGVGVGPLRGSARGA